MARGKQREDAILLATLALLREGGYDAMTMDAVAARAQASKATIYRRWTNKAQLVAAALDMLDASDNAAIPDTGALRSDLIAVMKSLRAKATQPYVALMNEVVAAARRDKQLAGLLRKHTQDEELSPLREVLRRAARRRDFSKAVDHTLVHDVAEAMILRQLQLELAFDDVFIRRTVDRVLLPLLQAKT